MIVSQVNTNCSNIFRFDNVIPDHVCDLLTDYMVTLKGDKKYSPDKMPWTQGDSQYWKSIDNNYIFARIESFRELATYLVSNCFQERVYPFFTDIVLWRENSFMDQHVDDGSKHVGNLSQESIDNNLKPRKYSSVTYLNDNYVGGETVIKTEEGQYISYPKKGSILAFKSSSEHGVSILQSGIRITIPIWFTDQQDKEETYIKR